MSFVGVGALLVGFTIAFVNGANDISKGIATLVGGGVSSYRRAMAWGTAGTTLGGLAAAFGAQAMVETFSKGLLVSETVPTLAAASSTMLGAAGWVLMATRTALPVSTTHAIVGSIAGVGTFAYGPRAVHWAALGGKIALPLLLSPLVSLLITLVLVRILFRSSGAPTDCLCAEVAPPFAARAVSETEVVPSYRGAVVLMAANEAACIVERPAAMRLTVQHAHWLTSGATSFARGMSDAPKMAALLLVASGLSGARIPMLGVFGVIVCGILFGSWIGGLRVTQRLAQKITPMNPWEGFTANLVTSVLVAAGAIGGLPMSTTHVSSTAILGVGIYKGRKSVNWTSVREIGLAWLVTVPAAAGLGILFYVLLRGVN